MKNILIVAILCALFSCSEKEVDTTTVLSGTIKNTQQDSLRIISNDFKSAIALSENGTFSDTLSIDKDGIFDLYVGRERTSLYLQQGKDVNISLDAKQFDESITYSGDLSKENNYLAKKFLMNEDAFDVREFFSTSEEEFIKNLKNHKKREDSLLEASGIKNKDFIKAEKNDLKYDYATNLEMYEQYHGYFTGNSDFKVSEGFYSPLNDINYSDTTAFRSSSTYQNLLETHFNRLAEQTRKENDANYTVAFLQTVDENLPDSYAKNQLMSNFLKYNLKPDAGLEKAYAIYKNSDPNPENLEKITERYNTIKVLTKGNPSPGFDYENHKGGTTSLADLKGKNVYIDVWATWCGPCIREIPYLKELEKDYHGKNIEFVSISIDQQKDHEKWNDMVDDKNLGGIQLFADNDWKSKFVTDYAILGIPRFILIDKEGNIVSADAPRPSSKEIRPLFDSVL
ncbi:TlpA family protein disulfide reductase [Marixanthomonas spongiae]|uniref:TlpA family protein disulfide reductase n=1 Tax=Marixanthomonas spongiae TaxID=2174845 RepID=A0A2U0HY60_9FLAO|nr:TlpA disulfide reductase family protein [Marixanthomonas spongiae]PVW13777.1 TlpA family protein disulfide reductase [Marixanthomonas spongiae]